MNHVTGFFCFFKRGKWSVGSMASHILRGQYARLNNKERRTAVKKFVVVLLFTMLAIPTMTVDPIVKTIVKVFTFHIGI